MKNYFLQLFIGLFMAFNFIAFADGSEGAGEGEGEGDGTGQGEGEGEGSGEGEGDGDGAKGLDPELKAKLATLSKELGEKIEVFQAEIENKSTEAAKKAWAEHKKEVTEDLEKINKLNEKQQEHLDAISVKMKKLQDFSDADDKKDLKTILKEALDNQEDDLKEFALKRKQGFEVNMKGVNLWDRKAADLTTGVAYTGDVINGQRVPGIFHDPDRSAHVRDILPIGTTGSDKIEFSRETAIDDGTAITAEGSAFAQSDFDIALQTANVRKIGTFLRISEEMMNDTEFLSSYINTRFSRKLKLEEDSQVLYGDGTGNNLQGLTVAGKAYVDLLADAKVNRYDVLDASIQQLEEDEFFPSAILLNPRDWHEMKREKIDDGQYVFPDQIRNNGMLMVGGVPILKTTAVVADDFLVGDFNIGAQIFDRQAPTIEFSNSDSDNFQKLFMTIRIWERLALPVYLPNAFIFGDFSTALIQGTA